MHLEVAITNKALLCALLGFVLGLLLVNKVKTAKGVYGLGSGHNLPGCE